MNPQQYASIGQKVKQQYPQYASLDDAELGQKFSTKYGAADPSTIKPVQPPQNNLSGVFQDPTANPTTMPPATPSTTATDPSAPAAPDYAAIRLHKATDLRNDLVATGGKRQTAINSYYDAMLPSTGEQAQIDKKAADKQKSADAFNITKSSIQNLLDTYSGLGADQKGGPLRGFFAEANPYTQGHEYEAQRKGLGAALKDIAGAGAGSGVRVTQAELNAWGNLVPSVHKTDDQNKIDIISLDKQLKGKFGQGLDTEYLQKFGVSPDDKAVQGQNPLERVFKGGANDVKDMATGLVKLPGVVSDAANKGKLGELAVNTGKGFINEYKDLITNPVNHVQDHPVNTVLDVLPFLQAGKVAMAGKLAKGADVAAVAGETGDAANVAAKTGTVSNIASKATDVVNKAGGGLKQSVRQIEVPPSIYGASREQAINQTLDKLGVKGTAAEQYAQLQPKMDQLGDQIHNSLTNNPQTVPVDQVYGDFMSNLKDQLRSKNLTTTAAKKEISGYIQDLYSGDGNKPVPQDIPTTDLFDLKKKVNQDYQSVAKKLQNGSSLNDREKVIAAARQTLDDIIANQHPDVKEATTMQSHLYDAAESLHKARKAKTTLDLPFNTKIPLPAGAIQKGQDWLGNVFQGSSGK